MMNWQLFLFFVGITAFLALVGIGSWKLYQKYSRKIWFLPKPDAYAWIKPKKGGAMVFKKGVRSKENDSTTKHMTSNWLSFSGVSGSYLGLVGTNDGEKDGVPCYIFVEGDPNPKKFLADGSMASAVSAEVIKTSVRVELYTQFARKLSDESSIPMWVYIVGGIIVFVLIIAAVIYFKSNAVVPQPIPSVVAP